MVPRIDAIGELYPTFGPRHRADADDYKGNRDPVPKRRASSLPLTYANMPQYAQELPTLEDVPILLEH